MDPKAAINAMLDALEDMDYTEAKDILFDLNEWAEKGGFLPRMA